MKLLEQLAIRFLTWRGYEVRSLLKWKSSGWESVTEVIHRGNQKFYFSDAGMSSIGKKK